jgi:hypothetical protein
MWVKDIKLFVFEIYILNKSKVARDRFVIKPVFLPKTPYSPSSLDTPDKK